VWASIDRVPSHRHDAGRYYQGSLRRGSGRSDLDRTGTAAGRGARRRQSLGGVRIWPIRHGAVGLPCVSQDWRCWQRRTRTRPDACWSATHPCADRPSDARSGRTHAVLPAPAEGGVARARCVPVALALGEHAPMRQFVRQSFVAYCGSLHRCCGSPLGVAAAHAGADSPQASQIRLYKRKGRDSNPGDRSRGLTVFKTAAFNRSATLPR
jgi:hypothetical protein